MRNRNLGIFDLGESGDGKERLGLRVAVEGSTEKKGSHPLVKPKVRIAVVRTHSVSGKKLKRAELTEASMLLSAVDPFAIAQALQDAGHAVDEAFYEDNEDGLL